jgi:hypothetical protein
MPKVYAPANSPTDRSLRESFHNYGIDPPVSKDKRGRFYNVEIPQHWLARRRASFDQALQQAKHAKSQDK